MRILIALGVLVGVLPVSAFGQPQIDDTVEQSIYLLEGEYWWGGAVNDGVIMPFTEGFTYDMYGDLKGNQAQPLLLSNRGRVIWSEHPFKFTFRKDSLVLEGSSDLRISSGGNSLKEAYTYASGKYFPPSGEAPDRLLFERPQYNTWIELIYDQNQADILKYAHAIIDNGFPPGVLMIDDNWQEAYGTWKFHPGRFPDPKAMMEELHGMGFKVMLWVCPFVSPDTETFRRGAREGLFFRYPESQKVVGSASGYFKQVALVGWWNGYSALLDFSNPAATDWFVAELRYLVEEFGVDGFKLDAGDADFYPDWLVGHERQLSPNQHSELFARIGLDFPLNEYRATWKMAGQPLAQRLRDKGHDWNDLHTLIPNITVQGLMGYAFTCPDMIGGGEFNSFLNTQTIDQELIVRSAQVHALMPMMQFSVAPWRILDEQHLAAVNAAVELRKTFTPEIMELVEQAAETGMPIVRTMAFEFPDEGFEKVVDQFLLGSNLLVAPVLEKGQRERKVFLPAGSWKGYDGKIYRGGKQIEVAAGLEVVPYFRRME